MSFVLLPEVLAMHGAASAGATWVPVNSKYHMTGDSYFYAASVREAREDLLRHENPVSQNTGGYLPIDRFRVVTYRLGAIGGLLLPDGRAAFLVSFVLFAVAASLLAYFLAREGGLTPAASLVAAVISLHWVKWIQYFEGAPLQPRAAAAYFAGVAHTVFSGSLDFEDLGDHFRYGVLSISVCVLWVFVLLLARFARLRSVTAAVALAAASILVLYTYPSVAVVGVLLLAGFLAAGVVRRDRELVIGLLLVAALSLVGAMFAGLPWQIASVARTASETATVHLAPTSVDFTRWIASLFFRPFVVVSLLMVIATRRDPVLFRLAAAVLATSLVFFVLRGLAPLAEAAARFESRGFSSVWLPVMTTCGLATAGYREGAPPGRVRNAVLAIALVVAMAGPAAAAIGLGRSLHASDSRRVPDCQWEIYERLRDVADREVLTLDWQDIQLLPVYTDADLAVGDVTFTGRNPVEEARRYLGTWRALGLPESVLRSRLEHYGADAARVGYASVAKRLDVSDAEGVMTVRHLFYDPYFKTFDSIPLRDGASPGLAPAVIDRFLSLETSAGLDVPFLLLSPEHEALRPTPQAPPPGFHVDTRTGCRTLYAR